eukprot:4998473-Alexandrium_andersonii.AAC.1
MSASLVGSEMCIRDRLSPSPELASRPLPLCLAPPGCGLSGPAPGGALPAGMPPEVRRSPCKALSRPGALL